MENASKALIMAGGIFIALLVITLLVFFYNNIVTVQNADEEAEIIEQAAEFNKQYDVYNRNNLYGSEILSLAAVSSIKSKDILPASQAMLSAFSIAISFVTDAGDSVPPSRYIADVPRLL